MCSGDRTQRRPARASSEERRFTKSDCIHYLFLVSFWVIVKLSGALGHSEPQGDERDGEKVVFKAGALLNSWFYWIQPLTVCEIAANKTDVSEYLSHACEYVCYEEVAEWYFPERGYPYIPKCPPQLNYVSPEK